MCGIFASLFILGFLLRVQAISTASFTEFDPHYDYIREIGSYYGRLFSSDSAEPGAALTIGGLSFSRFMSQSDSHLRWHPPLHHIVCALISMMSAAHGAAFVKAYGFGCNLLTIYLLFLLLAHFFKDDWEVILLGLNLVIFLPAHILFSNFVNNDVSFTPLCAAFLLLLSKWTINNDSDREVAILGLLCALLLLTKYTGAVCLGALNIALLRALVRKEITAASFARHMTLVWTTSLLLAGWFYFANSRIQGDPLFIPGVVSERELSFFSFRFFDLLSPRITRWHESRSVLTGFYATFLSLDFVDLFADVREPYLRNLVFCLSLASVALIIVGLAASLKKEKFAMLHVFVALAAAGTVKFLWKYQHEQGALKSIYLMFAVPAFAVYFAEGCRTVRARSDALFLSCMALFIGMDLVVAVYFFRYFGLS